LTTTRNVNIVNDLQNLHKSDDDCKATSKIFEKRGWSRWQKLFELDERTRCFYPV